MNESRKFERERRVDLSAWGYDKPAIVRRLSYGSMKAMNRELKELEGREDADDLAIECVLRHCLVDSPLGGNVSDLDGMDYEAVAYIAQQAQEHNSPLVIRSASASDTTIGTGHESQGP